MIDKENYDYRKGHRERVKNKVFSGGFSGLTDYEVLELLLFYAIPYKDVKPIAHRLIDTFGSLARVVSADIVLLEKVDGVGRSTALLIKTLAEMSKRILLEPERKPKPIDNDTAIRLARAFTHGSNNENFGVILLDNKGVVIKTEILFTGTVNEVEIVNRKFLESILANNASSVILFHNHPYGIAMPSANDIDITTNILNSCRNIGVEMKDHIVVTESDALSMRHSEIYGTMFD